MCWISIAPADRFRRLVVVPDVAANLPREVSDGRKDGPGEKLAFDFRKPELDLIEPRADLSAATSRPSAFRAGLELGR
jgi:hypothetical protein